VRHTSLLVALVLVMAACGTDPRGTRLAIQTREAEPAANACDGALAPPFRIARSGDALAFVDAASGEPVRIVWPFGFAAWLEFGTAVLYASDGGVVGREGDVLDNIGGAADEEGFRVCAVGARTYQ
jgi:hypothetical protein